MIIQLQGCYVKLSHQSSVIAGRWLTIQERIEEGSMERYRTILDEVSTHDHMIM